MRGGVIEGQREYFLTLSCPDRIGIVHAVSGFVAEQSCSILDSQQFGDLTTGRFFMRVHFAATTDAADIGDTGETGEAAASSMLAAAFLPTATAFTMTWSLQDTAIRDRIAILVSRQDHCLHDLVYRHRIGALPGDIVAVISNHPDCAPTAESAGIPFHHLPIDPANKGEQENQLRHLLRELRVDLVVLARYMQVLPAQLCEELAGRAINIHHSFLPAFSGARPYQQAHDRGVKLIGATAHYVTAQLDEGPIIEQEVARVDHAMTPEKLAAVGRDLETRALARGDLAARTTHHPQRSAHRRLQLSASARAPVVSRWSAGQPSQRVDPVLGLGTP